MEESQKKARKSHCHTAALSARLSVPRQGVWRPRSYYCGNKCSYPRAPLKKLSGRQKEISDYPNLERSFVLITRNEMPQKCMSNSRSLLKSDKVTDEEILEKVSKVAKQEQERQGKLKTRVHSVQSTENADTTLEAPKTELKNKIQPQKGKLYDEVVELRSEVKALKAVLAERDIRDRKPRSGEFVRRPRGCESCRSEGIGDRCRHCFKCGGINHFARGCRSLVQGNWPGSL
ncbi:hypothetical protein BSL78_02236 [Apostichopus japonicus]|uniref:CCHC-type domain-containing protein n=1 Tax=Stichopus japonicus TaxID=307972 RepID=A0A2G8LKP8_STIJA|nr:hypothetical protein BSL78_02236 [Apostichopus japonicus]